MRRVAVWWGVVAVSTMLGHARVASAQLPVCPQPSPEEAYYTACAPGGRLLAARVLFDLAIDHVLKADSEPVKRRAGDLFRSMVSDATLEKNSELRAYLDRLDPLKLTKLDTATGLLQLAVPEEARRFTGTLDLGAEPFQLSWQLPARLAGGYWRTPGVLQIAFWEGQRATFRVTAPSGIEIEAEVDCLVISTDGIHVVTADASTPDILVRFDECE